VPRGKKGWLLLFAPALTQEKAVRISGFRMMSLSKPAVKKHALPLLLLQAAV
jgi:hypothetical protein